MALVVPIKTHNQSVIVVKIFKGVTAAEERRFEQENVRAKREQYLDSNPIERRASDEAYREKVALLKAGLGGVPSGLILDLGGNTGGESTVLLQEGFEIVISDINEVALALARERAEKFGLKVPTCVAGDVVGTAAACVCRQSQSRCTGGRGVYRPTAAVAAGGGGNIAGQISLPNLHSTTGISAIGQGEAGGGR